MVYTLFAVLPENRDPALVSDLPGHVIGGDAVPVGGPPAQGVEEGHVPEMLFPTGIDNV
jgi:hypothetical protein